MNKQVAKDWVDALRSGKYSQTREALRDSVGYCCIGVLCDLYTQVRSDAAWDGGAFVVGDGWAKMNEDDEYVTDDERMEDGEAPRAVRAWAGLDSYLQHNYIRMNDSGDTFTDIAAQIERDARLLPPNAFGGPL
jgi:hypothetical protein